MELWGGVECTVNRVGDDGVDQAELSGHNRRGDDLERFAELGLTALRYPLLWETFARAQDPERLWAWHDGRLQELAAYGVRPILGLVHHGSGPTTTDLLSASFAPGLAAHAARAARRYPWVRDWTPVNEPLTTARFSALYGHWYPHHRSEAAFWLALINQIDATQLAMADIRAVIPNARLIQTEDIGHTGATLALQGQANFDNERRWASWDMLAGRFVPGHALWDHVAGLGLSARLDVIGRRVCVPDVLGLNHYLTSDRFLDHRLDRHPPASHGESAYGRLADVEAVREVGEPPGLEGAIAACWARYRLPIALTEVHNGCTREEQMRWLQESWEGALGQRRAGAAIEALTVWSLLGSHDWDSLLTRQAGHYESGVFDVRASGAPRETALAPLIRRLAAGKGDEHPVLSRQGWWRGHRRVKADLCNNMPTRPLLIAGATGTLGEAFAGACRLRGIDHIVTDRSALDLNDTESIAVALDRHQPWAVVNCAAWVQVDDAERHEAACMQVNVTGALALAHACGARGIHYTGFSSDLVFDGKADDPYVESDAMAPLGVYGHSKAKADAALTSADAALIVRTAAFFSPYDRRNFAMQVVSALQAGLPFRAARDCVVSPTYVPDLVRQTLDLIIDGEIGLWHLVSDGALTWAAFAQEIARAMALPVALIEARPVAEMGWAAPRPRNSALTSQRGLIMPTLGHAIERFAQICTARK